MGEKLKESRSDRLRCLSENDRLRKKIHDLEAENAELKRRLLAAEKYKDQLRESKYAIGKLEYKVHAQNSTVQASGCQVSPRGV